jgi:hypothetical protein
VDVQERPRTFPARKRRKRTKGEGDGDGGGNTDIGERNTVGDGAAVSPRGLTRAEAEGEEAAAAAGVRGVGVGGRATGLAREARLRSTDQMTSRFMAFSSSFHWPWMSRYVMAARVMEMSLFGGNAEGQPQGTS